MVSLASPALQAPSGLTKPPTTRGKSGGDKRRVPAVALPIKDPRSAPAAPSIVHPGCGTKEPSTCRLDHRSRVAGGALSPCPAPRPPPPPPPPTTTPAHDNYRCSSLSATADAWPWPGGESPRRRSRPGCQGGTRFRTAGRKTVSLPGIEPLGRTDMGEEGATDTRRTIGGEPSETRPRPPSRGGLGATRCAKPLVDPVREDVDEGRRTQGFAAWGAGRSSRPLVGRDGLKGTSQEAACVGNRRTIMTVYASRPQKHRHRDPADHLGTAPRAKSETTNTAYSLYWAQ